MGALMRYCGIVLAGNVIMALLCSQESVRSSDISNDDEVIVSGVIFNPCGVPAQNAHVVIRSIDYFPRMHDLLGKNRSGDDQFIVCATYTNNSGRYYFRRESLSAGIYCIEAWDTNEENCLFIDSVVIDPDLLSSTTWIRIPGPHVEADSMLRPPGTIAGAIQPVDNSSEVYIRVLGLDVYEKVDTAGGFMLKNIPSGNHRLQIVILENGNELKSTLTVNSVSGATTDLGRFCRIYYNGNGNTEGSIPDVKNVTIGDTISVPGNSGNLEKTGFTFTEWNSRADGGGVAYKPGDALIVDTMAMVLYATWTAKRYLVTVANGAERWSDSVDYGVPYAITANADTAYPSVVWRVVSGKARIADSTAASTTVILEHGNAFILAIFKDITFQKMYGKSVGRSVRQTSDGGYIITGCTGPYRTEGGSDDVYLLKTTATGDTLWTKTFGGSNGDEGYLVQQTSDGGYIITGNTASFGAGSNDVYLLKTTATGDTLWTKTFGGSNDDDGRSVQQTSDGGYVITGNTASFGAGSEDVYLLKTTATGDTLWTKTFGGTGIDIGNIVQQTDDGGYIIVGWTASFGAGSDDVYLLKTNATGDTLWTKTFGGIEGDFGYDIQQTDDGGYIITGSTGSFGAGSDDVYLLKTNAMGDTLWTKKFGGINRGFGIDTQQTTDSGYIILWYTRSSESSLYLIKTDENGKVN